MNGGTEMDVREKQSSEKRLIDSKAFVEHLERMAHIARTTYPNLLHGLFEAAEYVKDFPAIDAVPVVRCRECKYHNKPPCPMRLSFNWTEDDDFCSYGERKEGAD